MIQLLNNNNKHASGKMEKSDGFVIADGNSSRSSTTTSSSYEMFPPAPRLSSFDHENNLSHSTSDAVLKKKSSNFGQVVEVKLVTDESGKRSKGFAFIQYTSQDNAVLALESKSYSESINIVLYAIPSKILFRELSFLSCIGRYPIYPVSLLYKIPPAFFKVVSSLANK
ncbi:hypothetical protein MKX01_011677 [Papaver californicum]|nr:hypothetical protein MKX01_011677 [Papaver californicum]